MERLLLTVPEAAVTLGLSRSKLYELVLRGEVPSILIGRSRRISANALHAWVEELRATDEPTSPLRLRSRR